MKSIRASVIQGLVVPFIIAIYGLPLLAVSLPMIFYPTTGVVLISLLIAPVVYSAVFAFTAGVLSLPFHKAIVPGRFPRDLAHPIYGRRRLYGLCWTCVYYCKPVYYICLTIPPLKAMLFRLFGYRGSLNFTVYPDTWIRDLPLLDFGEGTYISNRATLGSNLALSSGKILVDRITLGRNSLFGHLAKVAPGLVLGEGAEIGAGVAIGLSVKIGDGALVQPSCSLNHYSTIGAGTVIGTDSYVDARAEICPGLNIPAASVVPARARIKTNEDVQELFSAKTATGSRSRKESTTPVDTGVCA